MAPQFTHSRPSPGNSSRYSGRDIQGVRVRSRPHPTGSPRAGLPTGTLWERVPNSLSPATPLQGTISALGGVYLHPTKCGPNPFIPSTPYFFNILLKDCVFPHPFPKRPSVAGVSLGWERAGNPSAGERSVIPAPAAVRVAKINWRGEQNGAISLIFHQGELVAGQWGRSGWERARGCPRSKAGLAAPGTRGLPGRASPAVPKPS